MIVNVHLKIMQRKTFYKKVGNKSDLRHLRTVERTEAQKLVDEKDSYKMNIKSYNTYNIHTYVQIKMWFVNKYKYNYRNGNNLQRFAEHNKLNYIETSAAEALNVEWAFEAVIRFGKFYIFPSIILYNFTSFLKWFYIILHLSLNDFLFASGRCTTQKFSKTCQRQIMKR